jgi:predicted nucleic acid-binding protein
MSYLADTNVAARWGLPSDPLYPVIRQAIFTLQARREIVYITPQILVEFHALATRPMEANGFGWTPEAARNEARNMEAVFPLLPETAMIYPLWTALVDTHGIVGRQVYDARLVAVMQAHGINYILTCNGNHFRRFTEITAIDPHSLVPAP